MLEKLIDIQHKLKAPKGQYNSFGKYKYRSCEDILEAVKPLLAERKCFLNISDEVVLIGDRFYVKATVTFTDSEDGKTTSVSAYAREEDTKKGMDGSQITGTASSYARKYALNGLFLIDDTKDADTNEYQENQKRKSEKVMVKNNSTTNREQLIAIAKEKNISLNELAKDYGLSGSTTEERYAEVIKDLVG